MTRSSHHAEQWHRAIEQARIEARRQSSLSQHQGYERDKPLRLRCHKWWIDEGGETIRIGRTLTEWGATRRKHRAYLTALREPTR